jgi:hypothetical protein
VNDAYRGAFGTVRADAPLLAREEIETLAEGEPVTVIWSGGNGPAEYVISVDHNGERYVWDGETENLRFYNPLTFVGPERFHTRVWRGHGQTRKNAEREGQP